jgi:hypothetical protein
LTREASCAQAASPRWCEEANIWLAIHRPRPRVG